MRPAAVSKTNRPLPSFDGAVDGVREQVALLVECDVVRRCPAADAVRSRRSSRIDVRWRAAAGLPPAPPPPAAPPAVPPPGLRPPARRRAPTRRRRSRRSAAGDAGTRCVEVALNVNDWISCHDCTAPVARLRSSTRRGGTGRRCRRGRPAVRCPRGAGAVAARLSGAGLPRAALRAPGRPDTRSTSSPAKTTAPVALGIATSSLVCRFRRCAAPAWPAQERCWSAAARRPPRRRRPRSRGC